MLVPHNRRHFFKYLSSSSIKHVLRDRALKWSHPSLFNDPFDNELDILPHEDEQLMADQGLDNFMALLNGNQPIEHLQNPLVNAQIEFLRQVTRRTDYNHTAEDLAYLREGALIGVRNAITRIPETNAEVKKLLADTSIFCVSETHHNLLMWAHYSQNHTGAVVQLMSPEPNSFLRTAQRVVYAKAMPRFVIADFMGADAPWKVMNRLTLTKSTHWRYEREWRVVISARDKTKLWETIPFFKRELGAVYLGCRMKEEDKEEAIALTRSQYPHAKLYQAKKHPTNFALVFDRL
jgi:hypothetical protein